MITVGITGPAYKIVRSFSLQLGSELPCGIREGFSVRTLSPWWPEPMQVLLSVIASLAPYDRRLYQR